MINFDNIKSYPTFSSYQRFKTIKSKELTERKNLKKGTIASYKEYLDKKNGFKCCNGKGVYEKCCYCLEGINSLNESCIDVSLKFNCFPCPSWRNILRVSNNFVSIHIANKGKYIIAAEDTASGNIYISSKNGSKWSELNVAKSAVGASWSDVVGLNSYNNYIADSNGVIYPLNINGKSDNIANLVSTTTLLAINSDGSKIATAHHSPDRATDKTQKIGLITNGVYSDNKTQAHNCNCAWVDISIDDKGENVVILDDAGFAFHSVDSGQTYQNMNLHEIANIHDGTPQHLIPLYSGINISNDGRQIIVSDTKLQKLHIKRNNFDEFGEWHTADFNDNFVFVKSSDNGRCIVVSTTGGAVWLSSNYGISWQKIKTFESGINDISIVFDDDNNHLHILIASNNNLWSYIVNV
jgi:hypothetical protein